MIVIICYATKDTPLGKMQVSKRMTVKEATLYYDQNLKDKVIFAYLRKFDGWHNRLYKWLKKEEV